LSLPGAQGDSFPQTRYSLIRSVQSNDAESRRQGLDAMAAAYWRPVYKYVRLRWHLEAEDARDFTQDFFARLIEKEFLDSYDPAKARLRTFLRTCIDRLFINQLRDAGRQKRGGAVVHVQLDFDEAEQELAAAVQQGSPDDFFDKELVRTLFARAVEELRTQLAAASKERYFAVFERHDLAEADAKPSYAELAAANELSVSDVTNYLAYARREFRRLVLEQLREMTASDEEFRMEARALLGVDVQ
jgi:RNA polymerase sigma factor (sigma-70 family)